MESFYYEYYNKTGTIAPARGCFSRVDVEFHGVARPDLEQCKKSFYFRSAYRNDPDIRIDQLRRQGDLLDQERIRRSIDNDAAVVQNYQRLAARTFGIFDLDQPMMSDEFIESIIGPVPTPIARLFPNLALDGLASPMVDGTFRFTRGVSRGFHFKNLLGGEKAAFDLVLDLVVAKEPYNDTSFCIDEPESHMNTRVQADLLSVLFELIPENCQLLLATHSIGMMRRAQELAKKERGSVVFLDFGSSDFDNPAVIRPTVPDRTFWNTANEIALDDLAALVAPERVVICEGKPKNRNARRNFSHDARCYQNIFGSTFPETEFVPGGNADEVVEDRRGVGYAIGILSGGSIVIRLVDRDARSPEEVEELRRDGVRVLSRRNLESYLFAEEILAALCNAVGEKDKVPTLLAKTKEILASRRGDAPDDLKPASGEIYLACKQILELSDPGNSAKTFMRDTLAPLVRQGTRTYDQLEGDIFGN